MGQQGSILGRVVSTPMVVLVALVVAATLTAPVPTATAQDARIALADGAWRGTMGAAGIFTDTTADATMIWNGSLDGSFFFVVTSGRIDGLWDWEGTAEVDVITPEGQVPMSLESVGAGPLTGTADQLQLTGAETTTGTGSFMGITTTMGPNTTPLDPIDVRFLEVGCNAVFGDWTTSLTDQASQEGLAGALTGWFIATPAGATMPSPAIVAELEARYADLEFRILMALAGGSDVLARSGLLQAFDLLEEAVLLEEEAAQLDGTCAYQIEGGPFTNPLTSRLASTLLRMVPGLSAGQLHSAAVLLVGSGAVGGAASQTLAADLEAAIADQTQLLHDQVVTSSGIHPDGRPCSPVDPCVLAGDAAITLHLTADLLGFGLSVDGVPVDIATILANRP